jgi:hypothetical protein
MKFDKKIPVHRSDIVDSIVTSTLEVVGGQIQIAVGSHSRHHKSNFKKRDPDIAESLKVIQNPSIKNITNWIHRVLSKQAILETVELDPALLKQIRVFAKLLSEITTYEDSAKSDSLVEAGKYIFTQSYDELVELKKKLESEADRSKLSDAQQTTDRIGRSLMLDKSTRSGMDKKSVNNRRYL